MIDVLVELIPRLPQGSQADTNVVETHLERERHHLPPVDDEVVYLFTLKERQHIEQVYTVDQFDSIDRTLFQPRIALWKRRLHSTPAHQLDKTVTDDLALQYG